MSIVMQKGNKLSIQKDNAGLKIAHLGLEWDIRTIQNSNPGLDYDLDLFFGLIGTDGKAAYGDCDKSLVFYGNKQNENKSVYVLQDNITGEGDGFDEEGFINFAQVPAEVKEIVAAVSIYDYAARKQNFGQVANAKYTIMNGDTNAIIATGDLSEDMSNYTGIVCCKFRRESDGNWSVKAIMEPVSNGMSGIISKFGISA